MKTYPGFYRSAEDCLYLYLDAANYYATANAKWRKADGVDILDHENDINVTHEYLQNTYGEVLSPEHAEFIIELAELHGFGVWRSGKVESGHDVKMFYFCSDEGELQLYHNDVSKSMTNGEKQITIPLPPKFNKTSEILNPKNADVKLGKPDSLKNAGDNLILGCEQDFKKSRAVASDLRKDMGCSDELLAKADEWPQVDSIVNLKDDKYNDGTCEVVKIKVNSSGVKMALLCRLSDDHPLWSPVSNLVKPKTPEEELRDDLINHISSCLTFMPGMLDKPVEVMRVSHQAACNLMAKYNITKKPQ